MHTPQNEQANAPQQETESNFWAAVPENDAVCVELERGGEGLTEIYIDREACPTEFSFKMLVKKMYGGGRYKAVMRNPDTKCFMRILSFSLSGVPKLEAGEEKPQAKESESLASLMMQMQERSDARMEKILEKMADKPAAPDAFSMFKEAALILRDNGTTPPPQKSLVEQMKELREAADLMGMSGGNKEEAGFGWVKDIVMEFGGAMAAAALAKGEEAPALEAAAPVTADPKTTMVEKLKLLLLGMVQLADCKVAPGDIVEKIKVQAGEHWPSLLAVIQRPDAVDMAAQLVPQVVNHREWFEGFRAAVLGDKKQGGTGGRIGSKPAGGSGKKPAKRRAVANG